MITPRHHTWNRDYLRSRRLAALALFHSISLARARAHALSTSFPLPPSYSWAQYQDRDDWHISCVQTARSHIHTCADDQTNSLCYLEAPYNTHCNTHTSSPSGNVSHDETDTLCCLQAQMSQKEANSACRRDLDTVVVCVRAREGKRGEKEEETKKRGRKDRARAADRSILRECVCWQKKSMPPLCICRYSWYTSKHAQMFKCVHIFLVVFMYILEHSFQITMHTSKRTNVYTYVCVYMYVTEYCRRKIPAQVPYI